MTSSNTFNVGAPTFGVRELCSRFHRVSLMDGPDHSNAFSENAHNSLKIKFLHKPSSNTLNVGAPTFSPPFRCRGSYRPPSSPRLGLTGLKTGHYIRVEAGLQPSQPSSLQRVPQ